MILKSCPFCGIDILDANYPEDHRPECWFFVRFRHEFLNDSSRLATSEEIDHAWNIRREDAEIARLKAENERLQEDVKYLVNRQTRAGIMSFAAERDHGVSSNAIVRFAYGGKEPSENEMPWDRSDLAACELAVKRLPEHRKSSPVMIALANARKAVRR